MTDKPTPLKDLKVGDRVKYIIHHDNGICMNYGMTGTIKDFNMISETRINALIIWDKHEHETKSVSKWYYTYPMLMKINNKPNYIDITRTIVMGS